MKKQEEIFIPSSYQTAIFDFVKNGHGNAVIEAVAGSGKTKTAIKCLELVGREEKVLLTAFNTDIVDELTKKCKKLENKDNIDCRTMHSLGYMILMDNFPNQIERKPNDFKYSGYIYNNISSLSDGYYYSLNQKDRSKYIDNIKNYVNFGRFYLCENTKDLDFIEIHYNIPTYYNEKEVAIKVMEWGKDNYQTIDFTDMVWLPNVLDCKPYNRIYDWIICDECQDTMTAERMLLLRCAKMSTRMLFFGEKIQCQPEGTMILMNDGSEKDIKDIEIGDNVITYSLKNNSFYSYKTNNNEGHGIVTSKASRIADKLITVTSENGFSSAYTPEHICLAKFNFGKRKEVWGIAIMQNRNRMFFVGKALLFSNGNHHGLLRTMRQENCYKGWLLEVCYSEAEANLKQIRISNIYNIPLPLSSFSSLRNDDVIKQKLEKTYSEIDIDVVYDNVIKCLDDYHRMIEYPISDGDNEVPHARTLAHAVRACNLFQDIMEMPYFDVNQKSDKVRGRYKYSGSLIRKIEYSNEKKTVYSLDVSGMHTYVADKIATHNCIYSFMGSDYRSFDELRKLPNTISLPLSITYRCSKSVVDYVKPFNNRMEPREDAGKGEIIFNASINDINDGDMVLCRNNAPLIQLYCELTKQGKNAKIRGNDIGSNIVRIIKGTKEEKLNKNLKSKGVFSVLYNKLIDEIDIVMNKHHITLEMAMEDSEVCKQYDIIQALEALSDNMNTSEELIEKIKTLFSDRKAKGISLSTIHKAKGLEADNVFICCPSLIPSKNAKEIWEIEQERNLEYVAYTRAKNKLYFLDESDFSVYSSNAQQKAAEILRIMGLVFNIHGGSNRCILKKPSHEAAQVILSNKTEINNKPMNFIDLGNKNTRKSSNLQLINPRRKKNKR